MVTDFRRRIHFFFLMVDDEKFQLRYCRELNEEKVSYFSQFTSPPPTPNPLFFLLMNGQVPKKNKQFPTKKAQAFLRLSHLLYNGRVFLSLWVTEELLESSTEYKKQNLKYLEIHSKSGLKIRAFQRHHLKSLDCVSNGKDLCYLIG